MRKVASAPSLFSDQTTHESCQQALPARFPKSGSAGALPKLAGHQKDGSLKRQGSVPSRLRGCTARAFPLAVMDTSMPPPPDQAITEEFAESARGLAGLECFELYGPQQDAPAIQASSKIGDPRPDGNLQQYDRKAAFASCLATPLTGEDKNLGELVESQAREMLQAAQQSIEARYQNEVTNMPGQRIEEVAGLIKEEDPVVIRRKRRLAEKFGLDARRERRRGLRLFEDCPEAEQMLSIMATLDNDQNRIKAGEDYLCIGDVCFPVEEVDESVFQWEPPHPLQSGDPVTAPLSQSI